VSKVNKNFAMGWWNRSSLMNQSLIIAATFYPTMFFHELGHYIVLRNMGATISSFIVGSPIIWRKGIFQLGLIPLTGYVWSSVDPFGIPPSDRIKISAAGHTMGVMFTSLAACLFHSCNLPLCSIFYQHFSIWCLLSLLPGAHPDDEDQKDDGSLVWLTFDRNWRKAGFWLYQTLAPINFSMMILRLCSMYFTKKGLIQDLVDTYNQMK
jgi:hypothetical protein